MPASLPSCPRAALPALFFSPFRRYPQAANSGRPALPEQLWVFEARQPAHPDAGNLPLVRSGLRLDEDGALPCFSLSASNPLHGHGDPLLGFPGHTKFFLLRCATIPRVLLPPPPTPPAHLRCSELSGGGGGETFMVSPNVVRANAMRAHPCV